MIGITSQSVGVGWCLGAIPLIISDKYQHSFDHGGHAQIRCAEMNSVDQVGILTFAKSSLTTVTSYKK